jgi:hypothetical protein
VIHRAAPDFWVCYGALPLQVRALADKAFALLQTDPRHASLHFKKVGVFWSARVGIHYGAVGVDLSDGVLWFWIGSHADYDKVVGCAGTWVSLGSELAA